jgi:hypothetical protein
MMKVLKDEILHLTEFLQKLTMDPLIYEEEEA